MKIKKIDSTVNSSTKPEGSSVDTEELNKRVYDDAIGFVQSAIESLGALARRTGSVKAKELIADLGVILFDMKGEDE